MRKNMKGTTVIEVVISFAIVALAVGIGLMGVGIGANFMNSGADFKRQRMEAESKMAESGSENVKIDGNDVPAKKFTVTDDAGNEIFVEYRPQ
ncbi:MAG: hypothetical protein PUA84_09275 [Oscillospiraceae bacterium]|nr:hypothetical protein [Oscillospiraceae bacterium]